MTMELVDNPGQRALRKDNLLNLFHNFRWLREVHFLIGGQVPEAPRFDSIGR